MSCTTLLGSKKCIRLHFSEDKAILTYERKGMPPWTETRFASAMPGNQEAAQAFTSLWGSSGGQNILASLIALARQWFFFIPDTFKS
ncbi:MAG: hypothetical protein RR997_04315, partial [Raoultibacter sp.]